MEEGRVQIKNRDRAIVLDITWDNDLYKHTVLWMVRYGDSGYPRYGCTNVLCVMPRSTKYLYPDDCIKNNDLVFIDTHKEIKTWMNFKVVDRSKK